MAWDPRETDDPYYESPQGSVGGRSYEPTDDEAMAMLAMGQGGPREQRLAARGRAATVYDAEFSLSGTNGGKHTGPGYAMARRAARAAGVIRATDEGMSPTEIAARFRARDDRKSAS